MRHWSSIPWFKSRWKKAFHTSIRCIKNATTFHCPFLSINYYINKGPEEGCWGNPQEKPQIRIAWNLMMHTWWRDAQSTTKSWVCQVQPNAWLYIEGGHWWWSVFNQCGPLHKCLGIGAAVIGQVILCARSVHEFKSQVSVHMLYRLGW